ncbi:hypothetical protein MHL31_05760 [Lutibacter sp. A80]|uniref:hypothetical protein n=1 Tax=Lutibacter sp. A80 TaxID=2918453 RepID=UPI001F05E196|nr:hypothetical protein [Lutibacter sp. A80]UMB61709.1 hypothetical protein MHL31_05760 [Lutibacter sp. A80]
MKKVILLIILLVTVSTTFGQKIKTQQKKINHFVEAATKEYDLNKDQVKELVEFRTEMVQSYLDLNKAVKEGLSKENRKVKSQEISKTFNTKFIKLVGKSYKEIAPFLAKMREELKNI